MQITEIFDYSREQANVSATDYPNSKLLKYANDRYHDMESAIKKRVGGDFFFDIFEADLVANQNEYSFKVSEDDVVGMTGILRVEVKRATTDTYYTLLKPRALDDRTTDRTTDTQPKEDGFYTLQDSSLFLYPTPENNVTNGLRTQAIINLIDLTATDTEDKIFPRHSELRPYHKIIAKGIIADIFGMKRLAQDKAQAEIEYTNAVNKMLSEIGERKIQDTEFATPSGVYFKY